MFPTSGTRLSRRPPRYVGANLTTNSITVTNQVMIGNSTVNTTSNSTHFFSGNSTVYGFANSTAEAMVNSTANSVTTPASITFQSNTTSNSTLSNTSLTFNTNSTINTSLSTTSLIMANSTGNSSLTQFAITFSNSTSNSAANSGTFFVQTNTTSNGILNSTSVTFNTNSTINCAINSTAISYNGVSQRSVLSLLQADFAMTANANTVGVQAFPTGQKTATLAASTTYVIEGEYIIANAAAAAVTLQLSFGNSAAIGSLFYDAKTFAVNATATATFGAFGVSNAAVAVTAATAAAVTNVGVTFRGLLVTAGAVNITPQIQYSAACANTPVMKTGSFIIFNPVTNSTVNTVGTWA